MLTHRDLLVASLAVTVTCAVLAGASAIRAAAAPPTHPIISSSTYNWNDLVAKPNSHGESRFVLNGPTATLENLEMHITTLNPGQSPHDPHHHPNEELIIIRQGTVETLSNGHWTRLGPGSVIFNGSNQPHGLRNVGPDQAIYHVINFKTAATPPGETVMEPKHP
jgi:quercetin dioxygenase-like cupin family protein